MSHDESDLPARLTLSPMAMSLEDVVSLLTKVGGHPVTLTMLAEDIDAGAPTNSDGTLHLVHYAAWIVRELADPSGE